MKYKLPKKFKDEWVSALRSDKYDQDEGFLYNDCGYFCALGVAFHAVSEIPLNCLENIATLEDVPYEYNKKVPDELSIDVMVNGGKNSLANQITYLNDNRSYSFKEIANWIEFNVKEI
jgi:hypothetical protein